MKNKTELDRVKIMAKDLLELPIKFNEEFGFIVHHPFISNPVYLDENKQLKKIETQEDEDYIRNDLRNIIDKMKDYLSFIPLVNKPYLPLFFKYTNEYVSDKDFAEFLKTMWIYVEFPNNDANVSKSDWLKYFKRVDKNLIMSKEELEVYNNLPNEVEIYRGVGSHNNYKALSWTLDYEKAKWFSTRFSKGKVYKGTIDKKYIFAYFNDRDESEVVVDYTKIKYND
ncbi:MAG: hypothetical protein K2J20_02580 [Bacilli bacterium]|nr:hypothetical protein [Bacilli bacterium]